MGTSKKKRSVLGARSAHPMEKKIKKEKRNERQEAKCHPVCARGMEFAPGLVGKQGGGCAIVRLVPRPRLIGGSGEAKTVATDIT